MGDIAQPVFEEGSLDGIFDSSVLHHVTTFGGYDHENAARALSVQARALKVRGVLVVRDFVDPSSEQNRDEPVLLKLPANDGASDPAATRGEDDPRSCSTTRLFERLAREFRNRSTGARRCS